MIKEKELREFMPTIKYPHAESLEFQTVANQIQRGANERGIPVAFYLDEVKYGTFGNNTEPCFVLYHPEHKGDYFKFCFRLKRQGNYAFLVVNDFGESKLLGNQASSEFVAQSMKNGSTSEKVGALFGGAVHRILKGGADKRKLEEEQMWYALIGEIIQELDHIS